MIDLTIHSKTKLNTNLYKLVLRKTHHIVKNG